MLNPDVAHGKYESKHANFRYYNDQIREHQICLYIVPQTLIHNTRNRPNDHLAVLDMGRASLGNPKISYIGFNIENLVVKRWSWANVRTEQRRELNDRSYFQLIDVFQAQFHKKIKTDGKTMLYENFYNLVQKAMDRKQRNVKPPSPQVILPREDPAAWPSITKVGTRCKSCKKNAPNVFCKAHQNVAAAMGLAAMAAGPPPPPPPAAGNARVWPAQTKKGAACKKCLKSGEGTFCHSHT